MRTEESDEMMDKVCVCVCVLGSYDAVKCKVCGGKSHKERENMACGFF